MNSSSIIVSEYNTSKKFFTVFLLLSYKNVKVLAVKKTRKEKVP